MVAAAVGGDRQRNMSQAKPQSAEPRHKHRLFRCSLRTMLLCAVLTSVLAFYVGSYYYLSRRGMNEAARYGMNAFLYVPADKVLVTEGLSGHYIRCTIYSPLNWLDRNVFGGPSPVGGITFHLS
jgi:hypothetical protein